MSEDIIDDTNYSPRSAARLLAVQAIYQASLNTQSLENVASEYLDHRKEVQDQDGKSIKADPKFFAYIVRGVGERKDDLGQILSAHRSGNSDRMEPLLKAILMCASFELLVNIQTDSPVILDEYLNVAHGFFNPPEVGLLNGILDQVAKSVRD